MPGSTTGTVYWAPDASPSLSRIHADLHAEFPKIGSGLSAHYCPGQWPAHCALLTQIELDRIPGVIDSLECDPVPLGIRVCSIGFAEFHPVRVLYETKMNGDTTTASTTTNQPALRTD